MGNFPRRLYASQHPSLLAAVLRADDDRIVVEASLQKAGSESSTTKHWQTAVILLLRIELRSIQYWTSSQY
jgi:hypothetical protein